MLFGKSIRKTFKEATDPRKHLLKAVAVHQQEPLRQVLYEGRDFRDLEELADIEALLHVTHKNTGLKNYVDVTIAQLPEDAEYERYYLFRPKSLWPVYSIVIDEAHRVISKKHDLRTDIGEPIIYQLARQFRKRGVSLWLADQIPS